MFKRAKQPHLDCCPKHYNDNHMKQLLLSIIVFICSTALAQFNPEAKKYLDQVAAHIDAEEGLSIAFEVKVNHPEEPEDISHSYGTLLIKGHLYKLSMNGTETYGDGVDQWTYLTEEREVSIQALEEGEITPASIFTIYQKGYRFRIIDEDEKNVIVELSPENHDASDYIRVTLYINKEKAQIDAFSAQSKSGHITHVKLTSWENKNITNDVLIFDEKAHPEVDVIDLR